MSSPRKGKAPSSLGTLLSEIRTLRSHYDQLSELREPAKDLDTQPKKPEIATGMDTRAHTTIQKLHTENAAQEARLAAFQTSLDLEGAINASVAPLRERNEASAKQQRVRSVPKDAVKQLDLTDPFTKCAPIQSSKEEQNRKKLLQELPSFGVYVPPPKETKETNDPRSVEEVETQVGSAGGPRFQRVTDVSVETKTGANLWANAENLEVTRLPEDLEVTSGRPSLIIEEKVTKDCTPQQDTRQLLSCASPSRQGIGSCIFVPKIMLDVASRPVSREFSISESLSHSGPGHAAASSQDHGHGQQHHNRCLSPAVCPYGSLKDSVRREVSSSNRSARQPSPAMPRTPPMLSRTPQTTPRSMAINSRHRPSAQGSLQQTRATVEPSPEVQRRFSGGLTPRTPHLTPRTGLGQVPQNGVVRTASAGQSPRRAGSFMPPTSQIREDSIQRQNRSDGVSPQVQIFTPRTTHVSGSHPPQGCGPMNVNVAACQSFEPPVVVTFQEQSGPDATQHMTPRQTPRTPVTTPRSTGYPTCSAVRASGLAGKTVGAEGVLRSLTPTESRREQLLHHTGSRVPTHVQAMQPSQMVAPSKLTPRKDAANTWASVSGAQGPQPAMPGPGSMSLVLPPTLQCPSTSFQQPQMVPPLHARQLVTPQVAPSHPLSSKFWFGNALEGSPRSPNFGNGGTAQTSKNLANIPLEDRLSFPDASCENLSVIMRDPDHDRLKAMQLAIEQATLREEHAQARRR